MRNVAEIRGRMVQIDARDRGSRDQIAQLQVVLEQASRLLARNSAEFGAREASMEAAIAELQSRVDQFARSSPPEARQRSKTQRRGSTDGWWRSSGRKR